MLVSALVTPNPTSAELRVVDALRAGRFRGLFSPALLNEYRQVLNRPRLRTRHGLSESEIDEVLATIGALGDLVEPSKECASAPDPKDQHVWDLLLDHSRTAVLVTGERNLIDGQPRGHVVVSAAEFVRRYLP